MWPITRLTQALNITYPIIQAPMAGITTAKLVAAVSNAGGLGSLGAALLSPEQMKEAIHQIREMTPHPFAVNLFAPLTHESLALEKIKKMNVLLAPFRKVLQLNELLDITPLKIDFEQQLQIVIEEKVPIFSFTFGILPSKTIEKLKQHGIKIIGTATTVREAKLLENTGADFVVAQGSEAGGHRGSAPDTNVEDALIGSMALIPQIVDALKIPVIGSGGIMDHRGIIAALVLGASGAQLGTAFMTCPEALTHPLHRAALLHSNDESTRITRVFTGRWARSIKNKFLLEMAPHQHALPDFYWQSALTKDIRQAAASQNNPELMSLWSGQAANLCQEKTAEDLMTDIVQKMNKFFA